MHNVRRREKWVSRQNKTEVRYEQHRNVGRHRNGRILRHLWRLGMLQVSPSSRLRDLNETEGRGGSATPLRFYLKSVYNPLTLDC